MIERALDRFRLIAEEDEKPEPELTDTEKAIMRELKYGGANARQLARLVFDKPKTEDDSEEDAANRAGAARLAAKMRRTLAGLKSKGFVVRNKHRIGRPDFWMLSKSGRAL